MAEFDKTRQLNVASVIQRSRSHCSIMGIINVTPDSFSDGGRHLDANTAIDEALRMIEGGADMIDIGGESTRPGTQDIPVEIELRRVVPVVEQLRRHTDVPLSIDTRKSMVAEAAIRAGADIINDVSALRHDAEMVHVAASSGAPVVLMHMLGTPATMQCNPHYDNVVANVYSFFQERIEFCRACGIEQIVIDPGIGFAKLVQHNLLLLARLKHFTQLGYPILVGTSRKSFIGHVTGLAVNERLPGSLASAVIAVANGASIIRAHDVPETRTAIDMAIAIIEAEKEYDA